MNNTMRILTLSGALLTLIAGAVAGLAILRRRLTGRPGGDPGGMIPLHELRAMKAKGEISDQEFELLRRAAIAGWGVKTKADNSNAAGKTHDREPGR